MRFFFDNNLSPHLANGMRAFQEDVTHLIDHFPEGVKDVDWLPVVAGNKWPLVTSLRIDSATRSQLAADERIGRVKTNPPFAFRIPPAGTKIERLSL
jgi:hypothetical protein